MHLKIITIAIAVFCAVAPMWGQEISTPLATMNGRSFTVQDLPADIGNAWSKLPVTLKTGKVELLELQIDDLLLRQEAKNRTIEKDALIENEVNVKVPEPDEKSITSLYDQNKTNIGDKSLSEMRPQLVEYLRIELEKDALAAFVKKLREKSEIEYVKDINSERFSLNDVLVRVNDEAITYASFTSRNGLALYEYEANVFDQVESSLTMIVDASVYQAESMELGIPVNRLIADEITSKLKDYSVDEQNRLEATLKDRLYTKYRVKYFISEPKPFIQNVSADDDPYRGNAAAKVTVVVFADYECPACAGIHPVIKNLAAKYGDQIRIVFRDFPLTKIHKNAFNAALAANAARKQGKFLEYSDLLYENQEALDKKSLVKYASELGLNIDQFSREMESEEFASEVNKDISDAENYGVTGTPSIFVNGYKVRTLSIPAFEKAIKRAISGAF